MNLVSPWFCLSMEDNINNHYLRAKKFSSKFKLKNENNNSYLNKKIRMVIMQQIFINMQVW